MCARVLLSQNEINKYSNDLLKCKSYLGRKILKHRIHDKTKKVNICPHCGETNGTVKKCGALKISYEKYRNRKNNQEIELKLGTFFILFNLFFKFSFYN